MSHSLVLNITWPVIMKKDTAMENSCTLSGMNIPEILSELDAEIARLKNIRSLISGASSPTTATRGRGRPKGSVSATPKKTTKRKLTPDARARIAAAQKKRWADQRKTAK